MRGCATQSRCKRRTIYVMPQQTVFPQNIRTIVENIPSLNYMWVTYQLHTLHHRNPRSYRHYQKALFYNNMPLVTY